MSKFTRSLIFWTWSPLGNEAECLTSLFVFFGQSFFRYTLKDRPQEVKETLFLQGMPVCFWKASPPSGNTHRKRAIKPTPHPDSGNHRFPGPPGFPNMQFFSSLQVKSFRPLLLESVCAFILRAGSRNLSTWNSCMCHPCINRRVQAMGEGERLVSDYLWSPDGTGQQTWLVD
jgi:hypothetical protein